jgi:hypothetical protein
MSLRHRVPWLLAAVLSSVAAMVSGAQSGVPFIVALAALLFALVIIATAVEVNRPHWRREQGYASADAARTATRRNVRLLALTYAWGACAMFGVYGLSGVRWRHGWQYGAALALVAGLLFLYVHMLGNSDSAQRKRGELLNVQKLTVLHGAGAMAGVGYLVLSGKLWSTKPDWAGSMIFLAGSLAVAALCLIAAVTQSKLASGSQAVTPAGSDPATGS